tara:strand:+ start:222 stop:458 length:237 start_codon:yes stop_codon:yes gene_type:complete
MNQFNFPEDKWQHVLDDDEATFDMQLWSEEGHKYVTFCPTYAVNGADGADGKWTISPDTSVETTYRLVETYVSNGDGN